MNYIAATPEYGLILRKDALIERGISPASLASAIDGIDVIGEDAKLISIGPLFGEEALKSTMSKFLELKLEYADDYIEINIMLPAWIKLGVSSV